jgi:hypothetical protein
MECQSKYKKPKINTAPKATQESCVKKSLVEILESSKSPAKTINPALKSMPLELFIQINLARKNKNGQIKTRRKTK